MKLTQLYVLSTNFNDFFSLILAYWKLEKARSRTRAYLSGFSKVILPILHDRNSRKINSAALS